MNDSYDNYLVGKIRCLVRRSSLNTVQIHYIPGHSGVSGNEITDATARDASIFGIRVNIK